MKKRSFKPGYEFIFSLCILAILGLPPLVVAQSTKDMDITIANGDTTINGKNIKELSGKERRQALSYIGNISSMKTDIKKTIIIDAPNEDSKSTLAHKHKKGDSTFAYNYKMHTDVKQHMGMPNFHANRDDEGEGHMGFNHKNTQNFIYSSTDNNGINTRVSFHVSDHLGPLDADVIKDENQQLDMLDLQDLNIVPEFSAGKILLLFNLPSKTIAEVKLKDSKGTILWSEKAINGKFSTTFNLGLNGIYYLQVKQAGKVTVKKIVKE